MATFDQLYQMMQGQQSPLFNLQQIQTQMPGRINAPAPPGGNTEAAGQFARQMNQIGVADRAQQGIDVAQQRADTERERARALADIQMQTYRAEQEQLQRKRADREAYAGQEGMSPVQQAAIRAGHGDKIASGIMREPPAPMAIIGPDGKPVYVPRSQAVGQEPYKTPMVSILPAPKLPTGYEATQGPGGELVARKIKGIETADAAKKKAILGKTLASLDRLEGLFAESGTEVMPGAAKTKLRTEYTNLLLELKNAKELGVLAGPDLQLMKDMLSDPTSIGSGVTPNETYEAQMDQVRKILTGYIPEEDPDVPPPQGFTRRVD